jgi:hypothetical protein
MWLLYIILMIIKQICVPDRLGVGMESAGYLITIDFIVWTMIDITIKSEKNTLIKVLCSIHVIYA